MQQSLRRAGLGLALAGLWAGSAVPMLAADNGTVDAHVTVATPCLTVNTPTIDFGTLPFSAVGGLNSIGQAAVSYTNCSEAGVRVFGRAGNATGASGVISWFLGADPDCGNAEPTLNRYALYAVNPEGETRSLGYADQLLDDQVPSGADGSVSQLVLQMPCGGSDGAGELMSFRATLTASF